MTFRTHAISIVSIVAIVIPLQLALSEEYALERKSIEHRAAEDRARKMAESWAAYNYTTLTSESAPKAFLAAIQWDRLNLPSEQIEQLKNDLPKVIEYLWTPTLDRYMLLKTEGVTYNFKLSSRAKAALDAEAQVHEKTLNPSVIVETLWKSLQKTNGFVSSLEAACLDGLETIVVNTNTPFHLLSSPISKGFTIARSALEAGFEYTADDDLQPTILISFLARSTCSTSSAPVHLSLSWKENAKKWTLGFLITDVWLGMDLLF